MFPTSLCCEWVSALQFSHCSFVHASFTLSPSCQDTFFQSSVHFVSVSLKSEPGYINPLNQAQHPTGNEGHVKPNRRPCSETYSFGRQRVKETLGIIFTSLLISRQSPLVGWNHIPQIMSTDFFWVFTHFHFIEQLDGLQREVHSSQAFTPQSSDDNDTHSCMPTAVSRLCVARCWGRHETEGRRTSRVTDW